MCGVQLKTNKRIVVSNRIRRKVRLRNSVKFKLFESRRLYTSFCRSVCILFFFLFLHFVYMAEFSTPTKVKCKTDNSELNTPIKIPASPFLQQIGYGTGTYVSLKIVITTIHKL